MSSRRNFVKQAALFSAGILAWPSLSYAFAKQKMGLQLYTVRDLILKDLAGILKKVALAGYSEVETFDYTVKGGFWGTTPAQFNQLLKDNGLTSPSGHYEVTRLLKDGSLDEIKAYIETAQTINSQYVTIPSMGASFRKTADDYKRIAERMNRAGALCKENGITLGYHNHDFEFQKMGDTTGYDILLKETEKSLVVFEMDIYWVIRSGRDPLKIFEQNPGRFPLWHVKDMAKTDKDLNTEIGKGLIDFKSIFKKSATAGLRHLFVEQETNYLHDPLSSIQMSRAYIKKELI